ncbi:ATP-binding protein [Actinacidiphila acididurans]|uniref:ATP-binding protein n=1 Tax=Actinacidiphila acididurans TaxID=2784346 RepID=UPI001F4619FC|nr:ATP-binding protein [Actinacidiphila acididurans]
MSPARQQTVHAVNGFAYGCVGADIHVFGDGVPLYVLQRWRPETRPDPAWLLDLPSRMPNARFAVLDFTGREEELVDLRHWRDHGPRLSVRWLHAPGGQGKSRLASQFAKESEVAGWSVVTAARDPGR